MNQKIKIKRALLSVYDKKDIVTLAKVLNKYKVQIISTGGTAQKLAQSNIPFTPIEEVTGRTEAFGGRMKTLSYQISSGLLFRRDDPKDLLEVQTGLADPFKVYRFC